MSAFFKDNFQQNFQVQKSVFMKYLLFYLRLFGCTVCLVVLYVAGYYLVQSEEEYSHICKAKPPAIQTDKNKW